VKIVVLDGYALNPGDLSWGSLEAMGDLVVHDRTPPSLVLDRAAGATVLLTNKTVLGRAHFASLADLRYVGVLATGYNVVDVAAAAEHGVVVTNVPSYATDSVAQLVFAHLLNWCHRVDEHAQGVRDGKWCGARDFCYQDFPLVELCGKTMGLVGFGRIGQSTAKLALAFGMRVVANDTAFDVSPLAEVEMMGLDELLSCSDVVSLHCPLAADTRKLICADTIALMKRSAFLINTSRGGLIDELALAEALNTGRIGGAGLDVLSEEPPRNDNPLLCARNCFVTPHLAWATLAARGRLLAAAVENVKAFLAGRARNAV
jgi:glycerate dehydrogenase